ncbi:sporulation membrane protein YtaF [Alicyclobacillus sp. SO9]|uniref:sporulation membrane protein YtaF n=1 Tax=Alicyclobacillus sp. SO9 TaxID=2665646 RepID=UPI0018E8EB05|nr:sporulation membrane protein YtaF [Alicyclobacillus sp. SO9]QQE79590.1 sporulation membrane protein YtaF [Alicyclobacillus sp. SO9]QQE81562.1 sporulation membrane protein YtaF [Alicyclobacillus sp. SO9]
MLMLLLSALLFSISSNLDNVVVGTAYGIKKIRIGIIANFIIAVVTTTGTFLSMSAGSYIAKFMPQSVSNVLGAAIIVVVGIYFVIQSLIKLIHNTNARELALKDLSHMVEYAERSDVDKSGHIDAKEAFMLALGLTFNNLGTGIAASITGVNIFLTVISTFLISILTIILGYSIGKNVLGRFFGKYAPLIAGVLLIVLGFIEMFN